MKAPGTAYDDELGKDPQPADMTGYVRHRASDNGGVHINSGIPNHAFYLAATGSAATPGRRPAKIWYQTLTDSRLRRTANFASLRAAHDRQCRQALRHGQRRAGGRPGRLGQGRGPHKEGLALVA